MYAPKRGRGKLLSRGLKKRDAGRPCYERTSSEEKKQSIRHKNEETIILLFTPRRKN